MDRSDDYRHSLVVVAIPSDNDYVRRLSSEKEPHLTLLYLGEDQFSSSELELVFKYVEHAASTLQPFTMDVKKRGELGDEKADVLYLNDVWGNQSLRDFRYQLLKNDLIAKAYLSAEQFPQWTPHVTLGYPSTPAKTDSKPDHKVWYIDFDRIALWTGDSEGPTFALSSNYDDTEVAMPQMEGGRLAMSDALSHYGIKGMKWGVRRSDAQLSRGPSSGGERPTGPALKISDDVKSAVVAQRKIALGGTQTLSNKELQGLLMRMNLERQYRTMTAVPPSKSPMDKGLGAVNKALAVGGTIENVRKFLDTPTGKAVKTGIGTAISAGAAFATGGTSAAVAAGAGTLARSISQERVQRP